jgi:hypothetical protein
MSLQPDAYSILSTSNLLASYLRGTYSFQKASILVGFSLQGTRCPETLRRTLSLRDLVRTIKNLPLSINNIFVLFYVLFVLCRSVYCLCVNVYCTVLYCCHRVATQLQFNKYSISSWNTIFATTFRRSILPTKLLIHKARTSLPDLIIIC